MAIELSKAPQASKTLGSNGKQPGAVNEGARGGASGFSSVMQSLSSTDNGEPISDTNKPADVVHDPGGVPGNSGFTLFVPAVVPSNEGTATVPDNTSGTQVKSLAEQMAITESVPGLAAQGANVSKTGKDKSALHGSGKVNSSGMAESLKPDDATQSVGYSFVAQKNFLQSQSQSQSQSLAVHHLDVKDLKTVATSVPAALSTDAASALLASGVGEGLRSQERLGSKSGSGQHGATGFDAVFGQTTAPVNPSDSVFVVPPASATVADTAVAETVSYWASHGVQTAELTLDGFGDSPVEVRILLNGDQAQVDFRTDQSGVRQVLEGAATQLKDMLSGQGLQLSGMSVGTSGQGRESGGSPRERAGAQRITLVKEEALSPVANRLLHPSVGRSLDLFV